MNVTTPHSVLVTGGAGFVGTRVVELLSRAGHAVTAVDAVQNERSEWVSGLPGVEFRVADLRDTAAVEELVASHSRIVHLAAIRIESARSNPRLAHEVNVGATYDLVAAAARHGAERVIFGSSHTVYGAFRDPSVAAYTEDRTGGSGRGLNMYAATKLAAEAYLEAFSGSGGPQYLSLRYGTIYGPHLSAGSNASILREILVALDAGERPVVPWTRRSLHALIFVDDVASATVMALEAADADLAVNVVGEPVSSNTLYSRLVELYGGDPSTIVWTDARERFQLVDRRRFTRMFGEGALTPLDTGLQALIEWHRSTP